MVSPPKVITTLVLLSHKCHNSVCFSELYINIHTSYSMYSLCNVICGTSTFFSLLYTIYLSSLLLTDIGIIYKKNRHKHPCSCLLLNLRTSFWWAFYVGVKLLGVRQHAHIALCTFDASCRQLYNLLAVGVMILI